MAGCFVSNVGECGIEISVLYLKFPVVFSTFVLPKLEFRNFRYNRNRRANQFVPFFSDLEQARLSFRDEIEINVIFNTRNQYFHTNDLSFWGHNIMIRPFLVSLILPIQFDCRK